MIFWNNHDQDLYFTKKTFSYYYLLPYIPIIQGNYYLIDLNSVLFLEDLKNLDNLFSQMISSNAEVDRKALSYFIVDDDLLYPDRIEKICNELPLN